MRLVRLATLLMLPVLLGAGVPEPAGYRLDDYSAPVPDTLTGGRVVDSAGLAAAMAAGAVVIDVLVAPRRPAGLSASQPWLPTQRLEVPGSLWWPEVGRGVIGVTTETWFRDRLAVATGGDRDRPLAFYCKAACWMGWNAAKRAIGYGYRQVLWFAGGAEAWAAAGYTLRPGSPEAVPLDP